MNNVSKNYKGYISIGGGILTISIKIQFFKTLLRNGHMVLD